MTEYKRSMQALYIWKIYKLLFNTIEVVWMHDQYIRYVYGHIGSFGCITIPKIMFLGIVADLKNGLRKEPLLPVSLAITRL